MIDLDKAVQFADFEGRAAVVIEEPDGSLSGWVLGKFSNEWKSISPVEITISARPLSREDFFEIFGKDLP